MLARTKNIGSLGGSVQLGDGLTPTSMPTFIGGGKKGIINGGTPNRYLRQTAMSLNGTYTVFFVANSATYAGATMYMMDCCEASGTGYIYKANTENVIPSSGTAYVNGQLSPAMPFGQLCSVAVTGITINCSIIDWLIRFDLASSPWVGKIYSIQLFQGTLTQPQIKALHERAMIEVNT